MNLVTACHVEEPRTGQGNCNKSDFSREHCYKALTTHSRLVLEKEVRIHSDIGLMEQTCNNTIMWVYMYHGLRYTRYLLFFEADLFEVFLFLPLLISKQYLVYQRLTMESKKIVYALS